MAHGFSYFVVAKHQNLLSEIVPFISLEYLDFGAIQNFTNNVIQSIV